LEFHLIHLFFSHPTSNREGTMDIPKQYTRFIDMYPYAGEAYRRLGHAIHDAGPLSERDRTLVKLGIAMGARMEGGVHSHVRKAMEAGLTADDIRHAAVLGITTLGFPASMANLSWVEDLLKD
jgi:alkylhydroperoxidase/carboxymuconolactone decarboxylase family protein YurZ